MARYGVRAFLLATALHLHGSIAVTLSPEKESVVRREPHRVVLDSRGEMLEIGEELDKVAPQFEDDTTQYCNYDFPMGTEGAKDCSGENSLILQRSMCKEAAIQSGANHTHSGFDVLLGTNDRWEYKHPKGCFKDSCGSFSSDPVCYFFNGIGNEPDATVTGQIVCSRDKHVNGTLNQADSCPDGYQVVDDEWTCDEAAKCVGYTPGTQFHIGVHNASDHLDYIRGCFIIEEFGLKKVYYNHENSLGYGSKGTNLCNVTSQVHWGDTPAAVVGNTSLDTPAAVVGNTSLAQTKNTKAHA